jgi:hypothetical protein
MDGQTIVGITVVNAHARGFLFPSRYINASPSSPFMIRFHPREPFTFNLRRCSINFRIDGAPPPSRADQDL